MKSLMDVPYLYLQTSRTLQGLNSSQRFVHACSEDEPDSARDGIKWLVRKLVESENED